MIPRTSAGVLEAGNSVISGRMDHSTSTQTEGVLNHHLASRTCGVDSGVFCMDHKYAIRIPPASL